MQSFMSQSHQRNYQGNVVFPVSHHVSRAQNQRHKILTSIAIVIMALAITVSGGLLGMMALHNRQLQHEIENLTAQQDTKTITEQTCDQATPCGTSSITTYARRGKTLERVPISEQTHETDELPLINYAQTRVN